MGGRCTHFLVYMWNYFVYFLHHMIWDPCLRLVRGTDRGGGGKREEKAGRRGWSECWWDTAAGLVQGPEGGQWETARKRQWGLQLCSRTVISGCLGGKQKKSKREEQKEGKEVTAELCDAASSGFHHLTSVTILNHWSVKQFEWGCPVMDWFPECQFIWFFLN